MGRIFTRYLSLSIIFILLLRGICAAQTIYYDYTADLTSVTPDGYANEDLWYQSSAYPVKLQSRDPNSYYAEGSVLLGSNAVCLFIDVLETELISASNGLSDGIKLELKLGSEDCETVISYTGNVISSDLPVKVGAVYDSSLAQYSLEVKVNLPDSFTTDGEMSLTVNVLDIKEDSDSAEYSETFIPYTLTVHPTVPVNTSPDKPVSSDSTVTPTEPAPASTSPAKENSSSTSKSSHTEKSSSSASSSGSRTKITLPSIETTENDSDELNLYKSQTKNVAVHAAPSSKSISAPVLILIGVAALIAMMLYILRSANKGKVTVRSSGSGETAPSDVSAKNTDKIRREEDIF